MRVADDLVWKPGRYSLFGLFLWVAMSSVSAARPLRYTLPTFLDTPVNITAVVGSTVILPCTVQNLGPKSVIWKRVDQITPITVGSYVFDPDNRYSVSHNDQNTDETHRFGQDNSRWNLQIQNVNIEHAGTYECQISTKEDFARNVTLHVIEDKNSRLLEKKTGIKLTGTSYVEKGSTIDLNCTATAIDYRPKGVDWFKDGTRIKANRNTMITEYLVSETNILHSRLEVERVTMDDAGTYVCRFSQEHVESVKVIVLNTESINKRRGTGTEGLEAAQSDYTNSSCSLVTSSRLVTLTAILGMLWLT
ncbi:hemicentin-1-like isoform X2 [Physella acuta]|uniref:hemicentin-1-like isoform X2 n=1 Tax=Physella acuta TaxID=109671 RepID=UPI0027DD3F3F|nr:hemicentin-1-like isoform X2 [Physella acuta]